MATDGNVRLGVRANWPQLALLVAVTLFIGAMVGVERSVLPLIGEDDFGLPSKTAVLSFIAAYGIAKAFTNLGAGATAERFGRRRLLIAAWALALPVPLLIAVAPSWWIVVLANVLLGLNQGLAWSMTMIMMLDLIGPRRRGMGMGFNEAAGYGGLAIAAAVTGALAGAFAPRGVVVVAGFAIAGVALAVTVLFARDTAAHVALERRELEPEQVGEAARWRETFLETTVRDRGLRSCAYAGFTTKVVDGLAWGLAPLYLAAHGASEAEIGFVAGIYPLVWGVGQLATGTSSDRLGRKPLIVAGLVVQAAALVLLIGSGGAVAGAVIAAVVLGIGVALLYPVLPAAVSDRAPAAARAATIGAYRFVRDLGYAGGALIAGVVADLVGFVAAIGVVAGLAALAAAWTAADMPALAIARRRRPHAVTARAAPDRPT